jgi:hypothetical protein
LLIDKNDHKNKILGSLTILVPIPLRFFFGQTLNLGKKTINISIKK